MICYVFLMVMHALEMHALDMHPLEMLHAPEIGPLSRLCITVSKSHKSCTISFAIATGHILQALKVQAVY